LSLADSKKAWTANNTTVLTRKQQEEEARPERERNPSKKKISKTKAEA